MSFEKLKSKSLIKFCGARLGNPSPFTLDGIAARVTVLLIMYIRAASKGN